jgi:hypothetical protein
MSGEQDVANLSLLCNNIIKAFDRGTSGINVDEISQFTRDVMARVQA